MTLAGGPRVVRRTMLHSIATLLLVLVVCPVRSSARESESGPCARFGASPDRDTVELQALAITLGSGDRYPLVWRTAAISPENAGCVGRLRKATARAFQEAYHRLEVGSCARFFGAAPNHPQGAAERRLQQILWGVFRDKDRPMVVAKSFTNAGLAEFNEASSAFDNGDPVWHSPNLDGLRPQYRFRDSQTLTAFFILHELAHYFPEQTGFRLDAGPGRERINESNSLMLINACFLDARRVSK